MNLLDFIYHVVSVKIFYLYQEYFEEGSVEQETWKKWV